ncbi:MAG TPA: hypothetical protein EYN67_19325 [Flavobacteriales bacterium]|nr:hypothetical protein [Methylococcaceae bacterium]HHZ97639.1 hypothetical protein [Flavobacteriales bacterium]
MPCKIVVKNTQTHWSTGMVIEAFTVDTFLSKQVRKRLWIVEGNKPEDFNNDFIVYTITDKDFDSPEILALLEPGQSQLRKKILLPQNNSSLYFSELSEWGEITVTWHEIENQVRDYYGN